MFKELAQLLGSKQDAGSLNILITTTADGQLSVTVLSVQQSAKTNPVLSRPLTLVATPEELDSQFAEVISTYGQRRASLVEQLEAETTILQNAEKESADKATKKLAGKSAAANASKAGKSQAAAASDDDEDFGGEMDETAEAATAKASAQGSASSTASVETHAAPAGDLPVLFAWGTQSETPSA
jgi:PRTRC genetic system protein E